MRVKVCGMTKAEQVYELDAIGVEFAGFIFYPKSKRFVLHQMPPTEIKNIEGNISKVGVFVNAQEEYILKQVEDCGLSLVQLHGDESPKFCENISNYTTVVKAFRLTEDDNIEWKIKDYMEAADMFLFDTEGAGYGGTGKKFDWNMLKEANINKPFFLSGGIQPEDVDELKDFETTSVAKDLFAVDINSRFEVVPGIKDMEKVRRFVTTIMT